MAALALALGTRPTDAPAAAALTPPGDDGFTVIVLRGVRFSVGPRSLVVDAAGTLHAFLGGTALRHAWDDGSGWRMETLEDPGVRIEEPSAAADSSGRVHVAYFVSYPGVVRYGTLAQGSFESREVATGVAWWDVATSSAPSGPPTAIAVAAGGGVHVAWADVTGIHAAEAVGDGAFTATTVATDSAWSTDVDLALDPGGPGGPGGPAGRPHLVYQSSSGAPGAPPTLAAVLAERTDAGWVRTTVESSVGSAGYGTGAGASLAFDPDGVLHVVHSGQAAPGAEATLRHARREGGTWTRETIADVVARRSRLVLGADGRIDVAVTTFGHGVSLRREAGPWTAATVGTPGETLALARRGISTHIAWAGTGGAFDASSADGTSFSTVPLARSSELRTRAAVAVASDGSPRFAVVREDADGVHLDLVRRQGDAWAVETVATDVLPTTPPCLRLDRSDVAHVAWETPDGRVRCATEGPAGWTAEDVASGLPSAAGNLALAVAPDGTRRVAYVEDLRPAQQPDPVLRIARETAGGWTADSLRPAGLPDVEVGDDGTTHAAWRVGDAIYHASDAAGPWTTTEAALLVGGWGLSTGPDLVLDGEGHAWIAGSGEGQFSDTTLTCATNRTGAWVQEILGEGRSPAVGFTSDGAPRAIAISGGIRRLGRRGDGWDAAILDAGAARFRSLALAADPVAEGGPSRRFEVRSSRTSAGGLPSIHSFGAAFDSAGAVHAAYVDALTGDLRYVTDRDPGGVRAEGLDVVRAGGTASDGDGTLTPSRIGWIDANDSGTKFGTFAATADDFAEATESFRVALADPSAGLGTAGAAIDVPIVNVGGLEPPPQPLPEDDDGVYFLPLRLREGPGGRRIVTGVLHTGRTGFPYPPAMRVVAAGTALEFGDFRARRGSWRGRSGRSRMTLRSPGFDAPWFHVRLDLARGAGPLDLDGPAGFVCTSETFAASSTVVARSRTLDLPRGVGRFTAPGLHLASLTARTGERGSVAMTAYLADPGPAPDEAPAVSVSVDPLFTVEVPAGDFRRRGDVLTATSRDLRVTLGHGRRVLRIVAHRIAVAELPDGMPDAVVTVTVGGVPRTLRTRVLVRSGRVRR